MAAGRFEGYLGGSVGVGLGEGEVQGEDAAWIGLVRWLFLERGMWDWRVGCCLLTLVGGAVWPAQDGC